MPKVIPVVRDIVFDFEGMLCESNLILVDSQIVNVVVFYKEQHGESSFQIYKYIQRYGNARYNNYVHFLAI